MFYLLENNKYNKHTTQPVLQHIYIQLIRLQLTTNQSIFTSDGVKCSSPQYLSASQTRNLDNDYYF